MSHEFFEAYRHLYLIASISLLVNAAVLVILILDGIKETPTIDWEKLKKVTK